MGGLGGKFLWIFVQKNDKGGKTDEDDLLFEYYVIEVWCWSHENGYFWSRPRINLGVGTKMIIFGETLT
jgi:hypothetical protein